MAVQDWDDNELGMMLAVVDKMSRIIAHVGGGEQGSHVLKKLKVSMLFGVGATTCRLLCSAVFTVHWWCLEAPKDTAYHEDERSYAI